MTSNKNMADKISSILSFGKSLLAVLILLTLMSRLISNDQILEERIDSLEANMIHNMGNLFGNDKILIGNDKIMAKKIDERAQETSGPKNGPMRIAETDSNEDVLGNDEILDERRNMVQRFGLKNVPIGPFNPNVWTAGPFGQRLGLRPRSSGSMGPFNPTSEYFEPIVDQDEMIEIAETEM